jgi:signal transduction histidine kinase
MMNHYRFGFLCLILLILNGVSRAQDQSLTDSLNKQLRLVSDTERIDLFNKLSRIYWQRSFDTSLIYARHALRRAEELSDTQRIAKSMKMVGNAWYLLGNYAESMEFYFSSLKLFEQLADSIEIGKLYNNLGVIYLRTSDYNKGLEYFTIALRIQQNCGNMDMVAGIQNNIGAIYHEKKEYDKAHEYFLSAYEIHREQGDRRQMAISLNNLGEVSNYQGNYAQALDYYEESMNISSEINDLGMLATLHANLGDIYLKTGQYELAESYLKSGLDLSAEIHELSVKKEIYLMLSELYSKRSDYRKALENYRLFSDYRDSILSEDKQARLAEMQLKFNVEAFQTELNQVKTENELKNKLVVKQRIIIISLVLITLLILSVLYINYKRNLLKKETNRLLTGQNEKLNEANKKLMESESDLIKSNATKDKFFSIIGPDLRNPLNSLLGFSELINDNQDDLSIEEIRSYTGYISEAAKNIHQLIENLLDWSRSQSGTLEFNPEEFVLQDLISEIKQVLIIHANRKKISISEDIPEDISVYADKNLLATIMRNLLDNAIKFTAANGKINIEAASENGFVRITVADTGIGMTEEQMEHLFELNTSRIVTGTAEEKGTGLGLLLCKEFVTMHKGRIWAESKQGQGSSFHFTLPFKKNTYHE